MPDRIGIVACSAPGAALCFETICTEASEHLGAHEHPEIVMHAFSFAEHVRAMEADDWPAVGTLLTRSAEKVASLGASFAICPDNTAHQALALADSPIPWLHIADAVAAEAQRIRTRRIGILGTRWLMEGSVYPERLAAAGISSHIPQPSDRDLVHAIIFDDLVHGRVPAAARTELQRIIEALWRQESCDAILLGCTELPLAVTPESCALPLLDSTRLLARAAIRRSLTSTSRP
jgi:aspartate racemase